MAKAKNPATEKIAESTVRDAKDRIERGEWADCWICASHFVVSARRCGTATGASADFVKVSTATLRGGLECASSVVVPKATAMLSPSQIEAYRRMSPAERWREVEALMTLAWRSLKQLPPRNCLDV